MKKEDFTKLKTGEQASLYTLTNGSTTATFTDLGATIIDIITPGKDGNKDNVNLCHGKNEDYLENSNCFGAIVERCANRIGGAAFTLDGTRYELEKNDGENNLHSGSSRWYSRLWKASALSENKLSFSLESSDGDQGFPGNFKTKVTYTLTDDSSLIIDYFGKSDRKTIWNPTFHGYFNLSGVGNGDILSHELKIFSDELTYAPKGSIPNGEIRKVKGTPMDFIEFKAVGKDIGKDYDLLNFAGGYDHNFIIRKASSEHADQYDANGLTIYENAILKDPASGRVMTVYSDMPGIQVYSGNFISNAAMRSGDPYQSHAGIALETQYYPNAINIPSFPQPVIEKDTEVFHRTVYRFSVETDS